MDIFVVNLPRSLDRRRSISEQLDQLGLPYRVFEATDGDDFSDEQLVALCESEARERFGLTRGKVGCAYTKYRLYRTIVEEGIECALVLEDDVELPPDFPQLVAALEPELRDDEIVLLLGLPTEECLLSTRNSVRLLDRYDLHYPMTPYQLVSATAFMLKAPVAARLAEIMLPIRTCSDWWGVFRSQGAFDSLRCVWPSPIGLKHHFPSDIRERREQRPVVRVLRALAANPRFGLFNAILSWNRRRATQQMMAAVRFTDQPSPLAPGGRAQATQIPAAVFGAEKPSL